MKPGQCYSCGAIIARKTANGMMLYLNNMRQIGVIFKIPGAQEGQNLSNMHIPVCIECCTTPDFDKIKNMMNEQPEFVGLMRQKAVFDHFEVDPVQGGRQILDA